MMLFKMLAYLYCKGGFHWSDGSEVRINNTYWDENEPSNITEGEMCTGLNSVTGKWFDTTCDQSLGYICKTKSGT